MKIILVEMIDDDPPDFSPVCDFCGDKAVRWSYRPSYFCCDECSAIVETADRAGLFARTLESFRKKIVGDDKWPRLPLEQQQIISESIQTLHDHFWSEAEAGRKPL